MSGTPKSLAPVRTESGLVVRATSSLNDLIAITPKTRTAVGVRLAEPSCRARSSPCARSAT